MPWRINGPPIRIQIKNPRIIPRDDSPPIDVFVEHLLDTLDKSRERVNSRILQYKGNIQPDYNSPEEGPSSLFWRVKRGDYIDKEKL